MKIFIPYLCELDQTELRFTLRSIEKYCPNDGIVIASGVFPAWLTNVEKVFYQDKNLLTEKGNNTHGKLIASLPVLGHNFMVWQDDIFLLKDWSFENYFDGNLSGVKSPHYYQTVIDNTIEKYGDIKNFDTHYPMAFNTAKVLEMDYKPCLYGMAVKSVYAHLNGIDGIELPDNKFRIPPGSVSEMEQANEGNICFSTNEVSLNNVMVKYLRTLYPNKSKYEI